MSSSLFRASKFCFLRAQKLPFLFSFYMLWLNQTGPRTIERSTKLICLCPGMTWGEVLLLLLLALGTTRGARRCCSAASTGAQQINTASIKKRTFTLPSNCPTSCGNISIQYPFGIGSGCYLPGFKLICHEQYDSSVPTRLFMGDGILEVTSINLPSGYVYFKLPVITMGVDQSSITASLIDLRNYHNFNFWATDNSLFVSGCNVNVSLVDLTNNNIIRENCSTICWDVSPDLLPFVNQRKECSIQIWDGLPDRVFLGVRLTRLAQFPLANVTAVRAHMSSSISSLGLSWFMDNRSSCTEAMKDMGTYACISSDSHCSNALPGDGDGTVGYYCRCSGGTEGNPYLTDGCKDVTTANIYPAKNCTRKCGSVDIPFPFGLDNESDCFRDSSFALFCNQTTTPPVLQYQDKNVTDVDVESGELTLTKGRHYSWSILHHSCEDARMYKSLFACVSEHSTCQNIPGSKGDESGYRCRCANGYTGNPYVLNGCQDVTANIDPAQNCTRKCGSLDVPFPFGLDNEPDCYRNSLFKLFCNQTTNPPVLQYQDKNVSKVDVERGELYLMEVRNSSQGLALTEGHYVYSWLIPYHSCEDAKRNKQLFACVSEHIACLNINSSKKDQLGYHCQCKKGYTGNPYILNGCQGT